MKFHFLKSSFPEPIQVLNFSPLLDSNPTNDIIGINAVLGLLRIIGEAFRHICFYRCKEAIEAFEKLPSTQFNTGWVSCQIAKAYYEMVDYNQAKTYFEKARKLEPYRTEGLHSITTKKKHRNLLFLC